MVTMLCETDTEVIIRDRALCIAPSEGERPISLFFDEYAEEAAHPSIWGGQPRRPTKLTYPKIASWEARSADRCVACSLENLFLRQRSCSWLAIYCTANMRVRQVRGRTLQAGQFREPEQRAQASGRGQGLPLLRPAARLQRLHGQAARRHACNVPAVRPAAAVHHLQRCRHALDRAADGAQRICAAQGGHRRGHCCSRSAWT